MTTVNERLLHEVVGHAIDLHRYSTGVIRRMIAILNRADADLAAALTQALERIPASSFRVDYLESLLGSVRQINAAAYRAVFDAMPGEMHDLAGYEVGYQTSLLEHVIPAPVLLRVPLASVGVEQIYAAALSRPFQGGLLKDWAASTEANRMTAIRNAIRMGYVEGKTTDQIVRSIRGTRVNSYADGLLEKSRRGVATIVQTALSHTAGTAREEVVRANGDIIKAEGWVSTLDARTSTGCIIRDKKRYTVGDHKPIGHSIPWLGGPGRLHFCCRSVSVPITKSFRELGLNIDDMPASTRASMDGQVPADLTYGQWLAKQSAARQDDILGAGRGKLLRDGGIPMDQMYSPRGDLLTLDQLRARDASAFRRAGL